jgi:hypothetical protein
MQSGKGIARYLPRSEYIHGEGAAAKVRRRTLTYTAHYTW